MTAITTTTSGDWNQGGTWTGGVVPGNGDTVTLNHNVTVTDDRTVGHSPVAGHGTKAILISSGSTLTINTGVTLKCRGDIQLSGSNTVRSLVLNPGAIFEFDASVAGTPATARYTMTNPSQYAGSQPCLYVNGSSGSRCQIRSNAGGANGRIVGSGANYYGLIDAQYCDFTRIGDASNYAVDFRVNSDGSDALASKFSLINCIFDACGDLRSDQAMGAYAKFTLQNCTFKNSVGTYNLTCTMYNDKAGTTSVRLIDGNVFDKPPFLQAPRDAVITNNFFNLGWTTSNTDAAEGWASFSNNLIRAIGTVDTFILNGSMLNNYFIYNDSAKTNPHFLQAPTYAATPIVIDGVIFEFDGNDGNGDCILVGTPAGARTLTVQNCIVLPNPAGEASGTLLSALGSANTTININKNTFMMGTAGGIAVGETYAGHSGMLASFKNNLAWDTSARGYKLFDSGGNDSVSNLVTSGNANYNGGYNNLAGSNLKGYNNLEFSAGSPGANDVSGDPDFVDATRDLAAWDALNGGAGTISNALAELRKKNDASGYDSSYVISNLIAWVKAGFAPQNAIYDGTGDGGADIGAMDYVEPAEEFVVKNQKLFIAKISSKSKITGEATADRYVCNRSFFLSELTPDETLTPVYGILREIDGLGQSMGEVMADNKYGSVQLDVTRGTLSYDTRFYDLFEKETILHQDIILYSVEKQEGVVDDISNWEIEFTGEITGIDIDSQGKLMTLSIKSKGASLESPNFQITKEDFPDASDEASGRFLPLVFGKTIVPFYDIGEAEVSGELLQRFALVTSFAQKFYPGEFDTESSPDRFLVYYNKNNEYVKIGIPFNTAPTLPSVERNVTSFSITLGCSFTDESRNTDTYAWKVPELTYLYDEDGLLLTHLKINFVGYGTPVTLNGGKIKCEVYSSKIDTDPAYITKGNEPEDLLGSSTVDATLYETQMEASGVFSIVFVFKEPILLKMPKEFPDPDGFLIYVAITQTDQNIPGDPINGNYQFSVDGISGGSTDIYWINPQAIESWIEETPKHRCYFGAFVVLGTEVFDAFTDVADTTTFSWLGITQYNSTLPNDRSGITNLKLLGDLPGYTDDASGTITGTPGEPIIRADHIIKMLYYLSNGNSLTGLDLTTFDPGSYAPNMSGATEGRQTYRDIMISILENAACKLVPRRSTNMLALWAYGARQEVAEVMTESDCRLESIEIIGEEGIVNRLRVSYGKSAIPLNIANQQQDQKNYGKTLQAEDALSISLYGVRDLGDEFVYLDWVNDDATADRWADYKLVRYAKERMIVTFSVPFWKNNYRKRELMDIVQLSHIDNPSYFGSASSSREPVLTTDGDEIGDDFSIGNLWRRAKSYKMRVLSRLPQYSIRSGEPVITFRALILDNPDEIY